MANNKVNKIISWIAYMRVRRQYDAKLSKGVLLLVVSATHMIKQRFIQFTSHRIE